MQMRHEETVNLLRKLIPSFRSQTDPCWCQQGHDVEKEGHTEACSKAFRIVHPSTDRAETGILQFEDDWPGVFIRGDNAFAYVLYLGKLMENIPSDNPAKRLFGPTIEQLIQLLKSCHIEYAKAHPEEVQTATLLRSR